MASTPVDRLAHALRLSTPPSKSSTFGSFSRCLRFDVLRTSARTLSPRADEELGDVTAEEAAGAGDEDLHVEAPRRW